MKFVYPDFLWALLLVLIPIIIHLFHFRRYKKIQFTNVQFLQSLQKETRSYQKVRNILILLARILAICFLVFAFAQPFIPSKKQNAEIKIENVFIYLDNSFSMEAESSKGPLIELAKEKAREIVKAYGNAQKFHLFQNNSTSSNDLNKDEMLVAIDDIQIEAAVAGMEDISKTIVYQSQRSNGDQNTVYWISDFQKSQKIDGIQHGFDSSFSVNLIPLNASLSENIGIDSVWLDNPVIQMNEQLTIHALIHNYGESDKSEVSLNLMVNGQNNSVIGVDVKAGASKEVELSYLPTSGGWKNVELRIDDKNIFFDDSYYLTFEVKSYIKVLEISGEAKSNYIARLFSSDPYFKYQKSNEGQLQVGALKEFDFIIANELSDIGSGLSQNLSDFMNNGGSLLIIPDRDGNERYLESFCQSASIPSYTGWNAGDFTVNQMALDDPLLKNVFEKIPQNPDYPKVKKYRGISNNQVGVSNLLSLPGNIPLLCYKTMEQGKVFLLAAPLDAAYGNLQQHALFVPLLLKMAFTRSSDFPWNYTFGRQAPLLHGVNGLVNFQSDLSVSDQRETWLPVAQVQGGRQLLDIGDNFKESGFLQLKIKDSLVQTFAMNFDRRESVDEKIDMTELSEVFSPAKVDIWENNNIPAGVKVTEMRFGKRFWKSCILIVLIFIGIEILLLRFWKIDTAKVKPT